MKKTLKKTCFDAEKIRSMLYLYEITFVNASAPKEDPVLKEHAGYAFYAISDAFENLMEELYVMEADQRVADALRDSEGPVELKIG